MISRVSSEKTHKSKEKLCNIYKEYTRINATEALVLLLENKGIKRVT